MRRDLNRTVVAAVSACCLSLVSAAVHAGPPPGYRAGETFVIAGRHRASLGEIARLSASRAQAAAAADSAAAEGAPEPWRPDRATLPANPGSPPVAAWPLRARAAAAAPARPGAGAFGPQPVGLSFTAATYAGANPTMLFPPDNMGAVGPTQFVVLVNGRIVSFDKATGAPDGVLNLKPDAFFLGGPPPYTTDPRIRYDRLSARWILTINRMNSPDELVVAVSDSGGVLTPATAFTFTTIPVDAPLPPIDSSCFADFPTLGVDANAVYIGTNNFCTAGSGAGSDVFVIRKSSLWDPVNPAVVTVFRGVSSATTEGPFTPHGVDGFDPAATEGYVIGVDNFTSGTLSLIRVADPGGTPSISTPLPVTVPATAPPVRVPHLGNVKGVNGMLDAIDDRLSAAVLRGRRLWTSHQVGVDNTGASTGTISRDGARWYEIDVPPGSGAPALVQAGTVFTPSVTNISDQRDYWTSSLMVSGQGHAAIAFSTAGSAEHINAATAGRLAGDPPGTMQAVQMLTNTPYAYNPSRDVGGAIGRRWGDYSCTCVDPLDDQTLWTVQQFCDYTADYGVLVARLVAPPPATPLPAPDVIAGSGPDTLLLAGTSSGGSGFFDPGPDPPAGIPFHHLGAAVTAGGVTGTPPVVLGARYVDPVTLQLVLDATSATANAGGERYTLTVTNPDGQAAAAAVVQVIDAPLGVRPGGVPFALGAVTPDPVRGACTLECLLPRPTRLRAAVIDLQGREAAVLADRAFAPGPHTLGWDGRTARGPAPPGVYFVRVSADGRERARRLVLLR